jgi:preprotein translocase SecE subunit
LVGGSIPLAPAKNNKISANIVIAKTISFVKDSLQEFKKLSFPSKRETYTATVIIFIVILLVSLSLTLIDFVISKIIGLFFGL